MSNGISNSTIFICAFLIIAIIGINLIVVRKWNKANDQQSLAEAVAGNRRKFLEILHGNNDAPQVIPVILVSEILLTCAIVVPIATYFILHNHGPNPCEIDHIDISQDDRSCSMVIDKAELKL